MGFDVQKEYTDIVELLWPDWEIVEKLGSGAFATVFRASRRGKIEGETDSAIKIIRIPRDDSDWDMMLAEGKQPDQAKAFFQEAVDDSMKEIRAMDKLGGNTNIVNIYDYKVYKDPERDVWYILIRMEYLEKVNPAAMDEEEVIKLGIDVSNALRICRKKNIVHRDVSLDNVFIHDGNYKLGDFGVAKVLGGTVGGMHSIAGKPLYMAPEVYNVTLTDADINSIARVDIYSLGILMYRLCNNMRYPFEDPDKEKITAPEREQAFKRRVIDGEALPAPKNASPELAEIILKACMYNPDQRYASAEDMRDALLSLGKTKKIRPKAFPWKAFLAAAAACAVLAALYFLALKPALFPEWSEWSDWSEARRAVSDSGETQEEVRTQYRWRAARCNTCGSNNPAHGEGVQCVSCGDTLEDNRGHWTAVYAYSEDITFQKIHGWDQGRYFDGKPYWFSESLTQYRYRAKNGKPKKDDGPYYRMTLVNYSGLEEEPYSAAKEGLRKRLEVFLGKRDYEWSEADGEIQLELPVEAFSGLEINKALKCYLIRPCNLYVVNTSTQSDMIEISRDDMESVTLRYGSIDGVNPADYDITTPEYQYLEVVLKDEYVERYGPQYTLWDHFAFAQDCRQYSNWFYFYTASRGDGKTYYIINNDLAENLMDLVLYNWKSDPLPGGFGYRLDLNSTVNWQNPANRERKGQNQCRPDEVENPSVTFAMRYYSDLSDGQKLDTETILEQRLDALGIPYALGTMTDENGRWNYVVKTGMSRMGVQVMDLLRSSYSLKVGTWTATVSIRAKSLEVVKGNDGNSFTLRMKDDAYSSDIENLPKIVEEAAAGDGYILIYASDRPLFAARADTYTEKGVLEVTDLCTAHGGRYTVEPLGRDRMWLVDVLDAALQTPDLVSLTMNGIQLNELPDGTAPSEEQYAVQYDTALPELEEMVREVCPRAELGVNDTTLFVIMNLDIDPWLPERAAVLAKEIYEKVGFPSLLYKTMTCCPFEEQGDERVRIIFSRTYDYADGITRNPPYVHGIFTGERIEPYREAIVKEIEAMDFYQQLEWTLTEWR